MTAGLTIQRFAQGMTDTMLGAWPVKTPCLPTPIAKSSIVTVKVLQRQRKMTMVEDAMETKVNGWNHSTTRNTP